MPAIYAHYRFGRDVLEQLPQPYASTVARHRELYEIGLQGPDIFFYYRIFSKNRVNRIGYCMHVTPGNVFFEHAGECVRKAQNREAAYAYLYGFINHFVLDSECHKYIEKMMAVSGFSHAEIEMEFDRMLMLEDQVNPFRWAGGKVIHPSRENAEVIAQFFDELSPKDVRKSLRYMAFCHRLLLVPNAVKRQLIYMGLRLVGHYRQLKGMVISEKPNPACIPYRLLLEEKHQAAVDTAVELIAQFKSAVENHTGLAERFTQTFGAGEGWESLQV